MSTDSLLGYTYTARAHTLEMVWSEHLSLGGECWGREECRNAGA